jgi:hypothetical protein
MTVQLFPFPRTLTAHFHAIMTQHRVSGDVGTGGGGKGMQKEEVVARQTSGMCCWVHLICSVHDDKGHPY